MLVNLSKLQDDCSDYGVFGRTTLFTFLQISHVKSGTYYLSFGCSTGQHMPSFLVKVVCFEKTPYDYRQPFWRFQEKNFNDEKHALILNRPFSTFSFILSVQDSHEKLQSRVQTGKKNLEIGLAKTREGLYHNPHFGGIKSVHGKVKSAGVQKSLTMHPGAQTRGATRAWSMHCVQSRSGQGRAEVPASFSPGTEPH